MKALIGQMFEIANQFGCPPCVGCLALACVDRAVWPTSIEQSIGTFKNSIASLVKASSNPSVRLAFDPSVFSATSSFDGSLSQTVLQNIIACKKDVDSSHASVKQALSDSDLTLQSFVAASPGRMGSWVGADFREQHRGVLRANPLVHREHELGRLRHEFSDRMHRGSCLVVTGPVGVGKSILIESVLSQLESPKKTLLIRPTSQVLLDGSIVNELERINDLLISSSDIFPVFDQLEAIIALPHGKAAFQEYFAPALAYGRFGAIVVTSTVNALDEIGLGGTARLAITELSPPSTRTVVAKRLSGSAQLAWTEDDSITASGDIVRLSSLLTTNTSQPQKSLGLLDRVIHDWESKQTIAYKSVRQELIALVANVAGLKPELISDPESYFQHVQSELTDCIVGQDHAALRICRRLLTFEKRLIQPPEQTDTDRLQPLLFVLVGPPGLGKTETARRVAGLLGRSLHIFPMNQYATEMARTSLLGSDPGYKSSGETRTIMSVVRNEPRSCILLDEIEKAHPDIQDALLAILEGEGEDPNLGTVSFGQVVFFMTSNRCDEVISTHYSQQRRRKSRSEIADSLGTTEMKQILLSGQADEIENEMLEFVRADKDAIARKFSSLLDRYRKASIDSSGDKSYDSAQDSTREMLRRLIDEHLSVSHDEQRLRSVIHETGLSKPLLDRAHEIIPYLPFVRYNTDEKLGDEEVLRQLVDRLLPNRELENAEGTTNYIDRILDRIPDQASVRDIKTIIQQQPDQGRT